MAKKVFVLDTNIFMEDANALYGFDDNIVVLTINVQQELDHHKKDEGERGYNTRHAIHEIDEIMQSSSTGSTEFALSNGGMLRLFRGSDEILVPKEYSQTVPDNRILNDVLLLKKELGEEVYMISNDVSMRISCHDLGIAAQPYKNSQIITDKTYTGRGWIKVSDEIVTELKHQLKNADNADYGEFGVSIDPPDGVEFHENQYFVLESDVESQKIVAQYREGKFYPINVHLNPMNVTQRNIGQGFALHALSAPVEEIPLVILEGRAGTAKTFLSLACGLDAVYNGKSLSKEGNSYYKLVFTRPNQLSDREHGFLKGDLFDKMMPLLGPAFDNLEQLIAAETGEDPEQVKIHVEDMFESGMIEPLSMAYMRGRSISHAYIIVDEAQNCTRTQIYDIISRAGAGTKVVLCGDTNQIDNPVLDKHNNGLLFAIERFKDSKLCAQVTFDGEGECVRSPLAAEATKLLSK